MRLSWPKANDRKRAMLGTAPPRPSIHLNSPIRIASTSSWDIRIHYYLTTSGGNIQPVVPTPISWSPIKLDTDFNLFQYCK